MTIGRPRHYDPNAPMEKLPVCDECGAPATFVAGWNPSNAAPLITVRCEVHRPTQRELDALTAAIQRVPAS